MKTSELKAILKAHHAPHEWALMFEVANATGAGGHRYADAIAMGLWPSRGLHIHGYELKVSRSDWRKELINPSKADEIGKYCDYWWVVTPPDIVKEGELPETWGHYEAIDGKLVKKVAATKNEFVAPLTRPFLAALLRRAQSVDDEAISALVDVKMREQREALRKKEALFEQRVQNAVNRRLEEIGPIQKKLAMIKAETRFDFMSHDDEFEIIRALNMVRRSGVAGSYSHLKTTLQMLESSANEIRTALEGASL